MQLLMQQMIRSVLGAIVPSREQELSNAEVNHIDLCVAIIRHAARELDDQAQQLPEMRELL